jgi:hypothetical protein
MPLGQIVRLGRQLPSQMKKLGGDVGGCVGDPVAFV